LTDRAAEKHVQNSICMPCNHRPEIKLIKDSLKKNHLSIRRRSPFLSVESSVLDIKTSLLAVQRKTDLRLSNEELH